MRKQDSVATIAHEWAGMAENDLRAAAHLLTLRQRCPTEVVCFHAQQCVEKYLKALLALAGVEFPRTCSFFRCYIRRTSGWLRGG